MSSPVHRARAGLKLAALAALSVLLFAVPTWPVGIGALAGVLVTGLGAARLPARLLWRQVRPVLPVLVLLLAYYALVSDVATGGVVLLRLLSLVTAAAVVTATTRVGELVAVVEWLCAPLRVLGVRPERVGLVIAMTLRFVPVIAERAARIREAQAARGGSARGIRAWATTTVPLLVQVLQLAHTLSEALDARGADDPARRPRAGAR
ncbi:energy-coupling factor transporter transmembrane component T [Goekera deserti]|uniref:energy-coupling factor transporter transmembrane component T n=1 Tax=Goekera deserti TaxID=2497753 RepID=UPI001F2E7410|nr:energy-coupling factor transporter transmembrane component T [Goekera deserti]